MFDRCAQERSSPPHEHAVTLTGIEEARFVTTPGAGEIFLGRLDTVPIYVNPGTTFDFRAAAAVLSPEDVALLSYAQGMLNWTTRTRFCSVCAAPLEPRQGGHVRACTSCDAEFYPRTDPAVMMLVTHRGKLLLAQHKGRGHAFWSTLAGFVEPGESLEEAARRELFEETGLVATTLTYFGSQSWPLPASLMIGFVMEVEHDAITIDESELADARFYAREELATLQLSGPISLSRWMIESWRT
ncbi:MAG TPA: NAD(+) diphosphatase [Thermoanaerobaculia bacterium]|nr:NAD(+) diphosphatase [Thermoanaerobaculia bacterium]